ncbi:MAG: BTAD domain-containing putative transcriptional regulator [Chloroflexota bacterium]
MLKLSLLGTFQATIEAKPLKRFRSDKVRALLAFLAVEYDRPHRRERLAALFWSDVPDSVARKNLRASLYRLRNAIESKSDLPLNELLDINNQTIQATVDSSAIFEVDVYQMQKLFHEVAEHHHADLGACDSCVTQLETAVSLYKGELLPGFQLDNAELFEEWLILKREQIHQQIIRAIESLLEIFQHRKAYQRVRHYAQKQLHFEPWHESAYRHLMLALMHEGQRSAALAQFEKCQQVLWDELGVEPTRETLNLYEQIKNSDDVLTDSKTAVSPTPPSHNLPARVAPYFGRKAEIEQLQAILLEPNQRLITLVGEGGVGKTSLAVEVGRQTVGDFADGVWFCQLAGLDAGAGQPSAAVVDRVITAVSQTLGLTPSGQQPPQEQLLAYLRQRNMLLILDNFEHLLDGAAVVLDILRHAPRVTILVTSRETLNFVAEFVYAVNGLPVQDDGPIVQLFADRASRVAHHFKLDAETLAHVVQVCTLVEGHPLAIELAAGSLRKRPLAQLLSHIQTSLDTLSSRQRDLPARHRSMRIVFEGSWALLTPNEQLILAKLSPFRGGFSAQMAQDITGATLEDIDLLTEKSLVQIVKLDAENGRFRLHELLRQFAAEQLIGLIAQNSTLADVHKQYSHRYLHFVSKRDQAIHGLNPQIPAGEIELDLDNIRKAWQTAVSTSQLNALCLAIYPISTFFQLRGRYRELVALFSEAVATLEQHNDDSPRQATVMARLLAEQARALIRLGQYDEVDQALKAGHHIAQLADDPVVKSRLQLFEGELLWRRGSYDEATEVLNGVLETAVGAEYSQLRGFSLFNLGIISDIQQNRSKAKQNFEGALNIWVKQGNLRQESYTYNSLGLVHYNESNFDKAQSYYQKALSINSKTNDVQGKFLVLFNLSLVARENKNYAKAQNYLQDILDFAKESGSKEIEARAYSNLGWIAYLKKDFETAEPYLEIALRINKQLNNLEIEKYINERLAVVREKKNKKNTGSIR